MKTKKFITQLSSLGGSVHVAGGREGDGEGGGGEASLPWGSPSPVPDALAGR